MIHWLIQFLLEEATSAGAEAMADHAGKCRAVPWLATASRKAVARHRFSLPAVEKLPAEFSLAPNPLR